MVAGPARGLQSSNCNLTTWDFLGVRPSSRFDSEQSEQILNRSSLIRRLKASHAVV